MNISWYESVKSLESFINNHKEIEIGPNVTVIPSDVRPTFYSLFDSLRSNFIKDKLEGRLDAAYELSANYKNSSRDVTAALNLGPIKIRPDVEWFLKDPLDGLMRLLFDQVFDLVKGKTTNAEFDGISTSIVNKAYDTFFYAGYLIWLNLALMLELSVSKNYKIPHREYNTDPQSEGDLGPGMREEFVAPPENSRDISFEPCMLSSFVVPRLLFYSNRMNCYVAIQSFFNEAHWKAQNVDDSRSWLQVKQIKENFGSTDLWPDIAIYTSDNIEALSVLADYYSVMQPDFILEVDVTNEPLSPRRIASARRHQDILQARLGICIACLNPLSDTRIQDMRQINIFPLGAGSGTGDAAGKNRQVLADSVGEAGESASSGCSNPAESQSISFLHLGYNMDAVGQIVQYASAAKTIKT